MPLGGYRGAVKWVFNPPTILLTLVMRYCTVFLLLLTSTKYFIYHRHHHRRLLRQDV